MLPPMPIPPPPPHDGLGVVGYSVAMRGKGICRLPYGCGCEILRGQPRWDVKVKRGVAPNAYVHLACLTADAVIEHDLFYRTMRFCNSFAAGTEEATRAVETLRQALEERAIALGVYGYGASAASASAAG